MRQRSSLLSLIVLSSTIGWAQPAPDLVKLRNQTEIFENIIGEVLRQNFDNPFALEDEPQAAYLPGYGVVVSFFLRINRATVRTPFGNMPTPRAKAKLSAQEQIQKIKEIMIQTLGDYGNALTQVSKGDKIAVCAHVEDRNEIETSKRETTIILTVLKSDVDLYAAREVTMDQFANRIEILEY